MAVSHIPPGYHSVTPYLAVDRATEAIRWYAQAFGATELMRLEHGGKIAHAEIKIGDSPIMLADEWKEGGHLSPATLGGSSVSLMVYVDDVDAVFAAAIAAGATETQEVRDQFYGDRSGNLVDPFGHRWTIATHVEDVDQAELERRMAAMGGEEG